MNFEDFKEWYLSTREAEDILEELEITAEDLAQEFDHKLQMFWKENHSE